VLPANRLILSNSTLAFQGQVMFIPIRATLLSIFVVGLLAAPSLAHDNVFARISSAPQVANVGGSVRVISSVKNADDRPQLVKVQVWLLRPWGQQELVGTSEVELRSGQQMYVGTPGTIPRTVNPGPHTIGIVIYTQSGRFIADSRPIRILPPRD
jgi:hypothetical protein